MQPAASSREKPAPVPAPTPASVRVRRKLSEAFEQVEERIRELAYRLFLGREPDEGDSVSDWLQAQAQVLSPIALVVKDQKKRIVVEGDLKGFNPGDIEVEVGANELRVFGSHTEMTNAKKAGGTNTSTRESHFYQSLPLPCEVDFDACKATLLKNGKLKITLQKKTDAR